MAEKKEKHMAVNMDKDVVDNFKKIAIRDDVPLKVLHKQALEEYIKRHGDGNPAFMIDQWFENPGMKAVPALFRDKYAWGNYINALSDKEFRELESQALMISNLLSMKFQHGDALARVV